MFRNRLPQHLFCDIRVFGFDLQLNATEQVRDKPIESDHVVINESALDAC